MRSRFLGCSREDDAMAPKQDRAQREVPQSLPTNARTDVLPDTVRTAPPPPVPPDSPPPATEEAPDGGAADHPIHDDDLEDRDSEDYERDIDQIGEAAPLDVALRRQS
jgi:hypothetical protein